MCTVEGVVHDVHVQCVHTCMHTYVHTVVHSYRTSSGRSEKKIEKDLFLFFIPVLVLMCYCQLLCYTWYTICLCI